MTLKPIFIFTWNPELFSWNSFEKNKSGEVINWITATRKINQGDRFILCRTGRKNPGIVAFGEVVGDPFTGINYRKDKGLLAPLKILGCICKKDSPALVPREFLNSYFGTSSSVWAPQGSGTRLKDVFYPWLEENLFSTTQQTSLKELCLETDDIPTDERSYLIKQRVGQNLIRSKLLETIKSCELSGIDNPILLHASHIVPWKSDATLRGNSNNVLLLAAPYDFLFDKGLISFDENGKILISSMLDEKCRTVFCLNNHMRLSFKNRNKTETLRLLAKHREEYFKR